MSIPKKINSFFNNKIVKLILTLTIIAALTTLATYAITYFIKKSLPPCPRSFYTKDNKCYKKECTKGCDIIGQEKNWDNPPDCDCRCPNGTKVGINSNGDKACLPLCGNNSKLCINPEKDDSCIWQGYDLNNPNNYKVCIEDLAAGYTMVDTSLPENDDSYVACASPSIGSVDEDTTYCYYPPWRPSGNPGMCKPGEVNPCRNDLECTNVFKKNGPGMCKQFNDWRGDQDFNLGYCVDKDGNVGDQYDKGLLNNQTNTTKCGKPENITVDSSGIYKWAQNPCNYKQNGLNNCSLNGNCTYDHVCEETGYCGNRSQDKCTTSGVPCSGENLYDNNNSCCPNKSKDDKCIYQCKYPAASLINKDINPVSCKNNNDCKKIQNMYADPNIKTYCDSDNFCKLQCGKGYSDLSYKCIDYNNSSICSKLDGKDSVCKYTDEAPLKPSYDGEGAGTLTILENTADLCYDKSNPANIDYYWKNDSSVPEKNYLKQKKHTLITDKKNIDYCNNEVLKMLLKSNNLGGNITTHELGFKEINIASNGEIQMSYFCSDLEQNKEII